MSGLEIVGVVASVAQLAGVMYSISKQLYEVANALSAAPTDIKDLAQDLELFHQALLLYSNFINEQDIRCSNQVIRLTTKIISRCAEICMKIDGILRKLRSGSVWAKMKWIYKEKEIVKLLTRLRDLKLSLMGVLSLLNSAKTDHMIDALGVRETSVLGNTEDERMSDDIIADVEETRRKLAGISIRRSSPKLNIETTNGSDSNINNAGKANVPEEATLVAVNQKSVKPSPKSLWWTTSESILEKYIFVLEKGQEPYFQLASSIPPTKSTPEKVFLDQPDDSLPNTYPCMYPGSCRKRHIFFEPARLEQHYRIFHSGKDESQHNTSQPGSQEATSSQDIAQKIPHANYQMSSFANIVAMTGSRDVGTASILAPTPTIAQKHALLTARSPITAAGTHYSNMVSNELGSKDGNLWRHRSSKADTVHNASRFPPERSSRQPYNSRTLNRQDLRGVESNSTAPQLPSSSLPQPSFGNARSQVHGSIYPSIHATWTTAEQYLADLRAERRRNAKHDKATEASARTNNYFIPRGFIDREVITADISRYLGNDAWVRVGTYQNPQTGQIQEGYYITAYRNLTTAMIADLKADSERWAEEKRRGGSLHGVESGYPIPETTHGSVLSDPYYGRASLHGDDYYVPGASMSIGYTMNDVSIASTIQQSQAARFRTSNYFAPPSDLHHRQIAERRTHEDIATSEVSSREDANEKFETTNLWAEAFSELRRRHPQNARRMLEGWYTDGVHLTLDLVLEGLADPRTAQGMADKLLDYFTLAEDPPSEATEHEIGLSAIALESVKIITGVIKVMKTTLEFKVGYFVWSVFCAFLSEIVWSDQKHSTRRVDPILPHMASIATLIARYNVMENIYIQWPSMILDAALKESLIQMGVRVLLYLDELSCYHETEDSTLGKLEVLITDLHRADRKCREFTIHILEPDIVEYVQDLSDDEKEERHDTPLRSRKHNRNSLERHTTNPSELGYGPYDDAMTGDSYAESPYWKRVRR